ncbi:MAG TPA: HmuY family protein [bacterium]|nr:HmuY family protein [bacterium]
MRLPPLLLLPLCLLLGACSTAPAEEFPPGLPHGEFTLPTDAPWFDSTEKPGARFDFSSGSWVYEPNDPQNGDIAFAKTFIKGSGKLGVGIQDTQPQSLNYDKAAPTDGYETGPGGVDFNVPVYSSHVYWVKTKEGHYAKFKIDAAEMNADGTGYDRLVVKWVYQPDGSTDFAGKPEEENLEMGRDLGEKHGFDTSGGLDL